MLLGASSIITVGLKVRLINDFTNEASDIQAQLKGMRSEVTAYQNNLRAARNMYGGLAFAGAQAMRGIFGMVKQGAQFDYVMHGVKAVTEATAKEYEDLWQKANKIGKQTMFLPADVAAGMRILGLAGFEAKEIYGTIDAAVRLAGSAMAPLEGPLGGVDILVSVMRGFQLSMEQAGWAADVIATAANKSNIDLTDLGEALKYVTATAVDLRQTLPEVSALVAVLGNAGIKGSMAGTAIENMFRYLAKGLGQFRTKRQTTAWEQLGLLPEQVVDSKGNLKNIVDIIEMMVKSLGSMDENSIRRQGILQEIFGVRGKRAGSKFIQDLAGVKKYYDLLMSPNVTGTSERLLNQMMDNLQGGFYRFTATIKEFSNVIARNLTKPLLILMDKVLGPLINMITSFFSTDIGRILTPGIVGFLAIKTAIWGVKTLIAMVSLSTTQMGVNFRDVKNSVTIGWKQMRMGAQAYLSTVQAANLAQGQMISRGVFMGASGRYYYKNAAGGATQVTKAVGRRYDELRPGVGHRLASIGAMSSFAPVVGMIGMLAKIGGFLGKVFGFLMGPWGIALSIVLPGAISLLTNMLGKNKESVDKNTEAINLQYKNKNPEAKVISNYFSPEEIYLKMKNKTVEDIYKDLTNVYKDFGKTFKDPNKWEEFIKQKTIIQIVIDGREAIKQELTKLNKKDSVVYVKL